MLCILGFHLLDVLKKTDHRAKTDQGFPGLGQAEGPDDMKVKGRFLE